MKMKNYKETLNFKTEKNYTRHIEGKKHSKKRSNKASQRQKSGKESHRTSRGTCNSDCNYIVHYSIILQAEKAAVYGTVFAIGTFIFKCAILQVLA